MGSPADGRNVMGYGTRRSPGKLATFTGVYIPVCLNILSILMFLRFGVILGQVGFAGIIGLLIVAYVLNFLTLFSLSAIASNGEVKGGGPYYLISRSLGPEFGGSIGLLFYLAQVLNAALNVSGLIDCIRLNLSLEVLDGYWTSFGLQTGALMLCTVLCSFGVSTFSKASSGLIVILSLSVISIPVSAIFRTPFEDEVRGIHFTGVQLETLVDNFLPHTDSASYEGLATFRDLFAILFPATAGILAGASMSGDLKDPSKSIPSGTLWGTLTTFIIYFIVIVSLAASTTHTSLVANANVIAHTNLVPPVILAGECSVTLFSALMGIKSAAGMLRALARDSLVPGLNFFGKSTKRGNMPITALLLTYVIAQVALLADLNQIATLISMGFQMTFLVLNIACFSLKVCSAPNFRPRFKFFSWRTAGLGSLCTTAAMFFIHETYAALALCLLIALFLLIHFSSPPKRWGDVSQNLIYHQVRKYLLRLKPEHIKFWRPHIILLVNNPRRQVRLIQFCNALKKGSLYILGHVIVTDDFNTGVHEARLQQQAWTNYISESSRIKAFVQLTMSPSIMWGVRNLILSSGLGGMRPNVAVIGFYNMDDLRQSDYMFPIPDIPASMSAKMNNNNSPHAEGKRPRARFRRDTSARLLEGTLPTDVMRTEAMMSPTQYMTILEDLALRHRLNVAVGYGFEGLESTHKRGEGSKKYIDLWPIQMSAEITSDGKNILTTNFDTYTLILQLGHILHSVQAWKESYTVRVLVFVEYESEVMDEAARVTALLDKLRIEAEVIVLWLDSGQLHTYDLIVNGSSHDVDWETIVNDALRDEEWWDDIQMLRGKYDNISSSKERGRLARARGKTSEGLGMYNPHHSPADRAHRRASIADFADMLNLDLVGRGAKVGIHTNHLDRGVFEEDGSEDDYDDSEYRFATDEEFDGEFQDGDDFSTRTMEHQPLLATGADNIGRRRTRYRNAKSTIPSKTNAGFGADFSGRSYGTLSTDPTYSEDTINDGVASSALEQGIQSSHRKTKTKVPSTTEPLDRAVLRSNSKRRSPSQSPPRKSRMAPIRELKSPQTTTEHLPAVSSTAEDTLQLDAPLDREMSGLGTTQSQVSRPTFSRQSSYNQARFSSRPLPDTKVTGDEDGVRTITFAEQPVYQPPTPTYSRQPSRVQSRVQSRRSSFQSENDVKPTAFDLADPVLEEGDDWQNSDYSERGGGVALSFNDLPSRAQHLVINELMRLKSKDTAVILTTLPIPAEDTSLDEVATIRYLSNIEVLCNSLPPTLMVLSNDMTVTISL